MSSPVTVQGALLQALVRGQSYGLELIERVEKQSNGQIRLHQGSVYPALRALEEEGLLESFEADATPERGGRPRRYYKLTGLGAKAAQENLQIVQDIFGLERAYAK